MNYYFIINIAHIEHNVFLMTKPIVCSTTSNNSVETAIVNVATELDAAASQPGKEHRAVNKVKQKARTFLQEMVASISPAFIRCIVC